MGLASFPRPGVVMEWRPEFRRLMAGFSVGFLVVGMFVLAAFLLILNALWSRFALANAAFTQEAGRSPLTIFPEILGGYLSNQSSPVKASRWLILGKDEVPGSGREAVLTDSMIALTYRPAEGVVKLLSLPRDWYHPGYATKINALYSYGLVREAIQEMLGIQFDHVIELSLEDVRMMIDAVGGVEVDVERSFTDERFPRAGVDVTKESDPAVLYETVSFTAGRQKMMGDTALKFMRSRHSADLAEGTDEARVQRQQKVIEALVNSFSRSDVIGNPSVLGKLYRWYADRFQAEVPLFELGRLMAALAASGKVPQMQRVDLPLSNAAVATESGIILVHPPTAKYGQWVYEAEDESFAEVHEFIQKNGFSF